MEDCLKRHRLPRQHHPPFLMEGLIAPPSALTTTLIWREAVGLTATACVRARRVDMERAMAEICGDNWKQKKARQGGYRTAV